MVAVGGWLGAAQCQGSVYCSVIASLQPDVGPRSVMGWWAHGPAIPWEPSPVMTHSHHHPLMSPGVSSRGQWMLGSWCQEGATKGSQHGSILLFLSLQTHESLSRCLESTNISCGSCNLPCLSFKGSPLKACDRSISQMHLWWPQG